MGIFKKKKKRQKETLLAIEYMGAENREVNETHCILRSRRSVRNKEVRRDGKNGQECIPRGSGNDGAPRNVPRMFPLRGRTDKKRNFASAGEKYATAEVVAVST